MVVAVVRVYTDAKRYSKQTVRKKSDRTVIGISCFFFFDEPTRPKGGKWEMEIKIIITNSLRMHIRILETGRRHRRRVSFFFVGALTSKETVGKAQ